MSAARPSGHLQSWAEVIKKVFGSPGFCGRLCKSRPESTLLFVDQWRGQMQGSPRRRRAELPAWCPWESRGRAVCSPWVLGARWDLSAKATAGWFSSSGCTHTHTPFNPVSPISFISQGQRPACLSLLIRAGFGLLWDSPDFLRSCFLEHHSKLDGRVAFNRAP